MGRATQGPRTIRDRCRVEAHGMESRRTPNLPTNIVDFRGFDSSIISIERCGILMSIGDLPESLSQAMLVGCNVSREIGRMAPDCAPLPKQARFVRVSSYCAVQIRKLRIWIFRALTQ